MADTITTALSFAYSLLSGDATFMGFLTGLYQDAAPPGTLPDYAVLGVQSPGTDTLNAMGWRLLGKPLLRLVVVGPVSDMANLSNAYARADALLQPGGQPTRATGGILACYREMPLYLPEPELIVGKPWVNLGGLYRVETPS